MKREWSCNPARLSVAVITLAVTLAPLTAAGIDADAAESLARRESCLKCHGIDKSKDGPAYKEVASKYKGKPDAEEHLIEHVKSGKSVQMRSGEWEDHRIIKTRDEAAIRNLVQWILSLDSVPDSAP